MTGRATSGTYNVSLTIGNTAPNVTYVSPLPTAGLVDLNSGTTTPVTFWFTAYDSNGEADIDDASGYANLSRAGEVPRGVACTLESNVNQYTNNYTCQVTFWYYDQGTNWNVNITINDTADARGKNDTTTFNISSLLSINLTPTNLTWTALSTSATNRSADNPINITNNGNQNMSNITIKAYELIGQTGMAIGWVIGAGNFSASNDTTTNCLSQRALQNDTEIYYNATAARFGHGTTTRPIYYCIPLVPSVGSGTYNTTNQWVTTAKG